MNPCDLHRIEQWVYGELDDAASAAVRDHLTSCPACSREAGLFERERSLFTRRAAQGAFAPPPFAEVLASVHAAPAVQAPLPIPITAARRPRRIGLILSSLLPVAAAFAFALIAGRDRVSPSNSGIVLAPGPACYEGGPFSAELAALDDKDMDPVAIAAEPAVAAMERRYAACLLSSPMQMGVITAPPSEGCNSSVTCEPLRPSEHGSCDGQAGGGDHP